MYKAIGIVEETGLLNEKSFSVHPLLLEDEAGSKYLTSFNNPTDLTRITDEEYSKLEEGLVRMVEPTKLSNSKSTLALYISEPMLLSLYDKFGDVNGNINMPLGEKKSKVNITEKGIRMNNNGKVLVGSNDEVMYMLARMRKLVSSKEYDHINVVE